MKHLAYIRNICAHHSRPWNRHLTKKMPLPKGEPAGLKENIFVDPENKTEHKLCNALILIQHLMIVICSDSHWAQQLDILLKKYSIDIKPIGFPENWKMLPLWQQALN